MKVLVLGATGHVGSHVVRELLARKQQVRGLSRDLEKLRSLEADVEPMQGDLLDPATVRTMYDGVDGVFVVNTVSQTEGHEGLMAVSAARDAGVKRLVYLSVQHADRAAHAPHFGCKVGVEVGVKTLQNDWTILRPSNFMQNDARWSRDALLQYGIFPEPLGEVGVSRVDVRDIAELAAIALTQPGHAGKTYDVVGPRPLTATQVAEIWSKALGKRITPMTDLDEWEKMSLQFSPPLIVYDMKIMYRHFQEQGLRGTDQDVATLTRVLGHPPRSFEDFVAETAKTWSKEGALAAR